MYYRKRYVFKNFVVFLYRLKYGILNLFAYSKLIWNDRDWDFSYFEKMILFKLNTINNNYPLNYGDFVVGEDINEEVTEAIRLLELAIENDEVNPMDKTKRIDAYCYIAEHVVGWWD